MIIKFLLFVIIVTKTLQFAARKLDEKRARDKSCSEGKAIIKTKIIDTYHTVTSTTSPKKGSAAVRAAVGTMMFGTPGAFIGAATADENTTINECHTTTFMIWYRDGRKENKTVDNDSEMYKEYMKKLEV